MSDTATQVRQLREQGLSAYAISCALNVSLSDVRRAEDPKAQAAHDTWNAAREAADEAEHVFGRASGD